MVTVDTSAFGAPLHDAGPGPVPHPGPERIAATGASVAAMVAAARVYQDLPDPGHLVVACAVAASSELDAEPAWLLLVAAPSSGKTEAIRGLDAITTERVDDLTAAGLLSWRVGKNPAPTGVLARIGTGSRALVSIGDLSTLLATSDRGGRDTTFALLRKVYDGHVVRDLGSAPAALTWSGKVTIVAAVTGVIDHYSAHADALGPRWLFYRLPERDTPSRRRASRAARRGGLETHRGGLAEAVRALVVDARQRIDATVVSDELADRIDDAALVTCWGRATVPRHGYGRREIDGVPVIEEPMRVVRQLHVVARGCAALGLPEADTTVLVRRVALDSMPQARRAVLDVLARGEPLSTAGLAIAARLHRHVARHQLEELEAIGVAWAQRSGSEPEDDEPDRRPAAWQLHGEDGALIADVLNTARRESRGWHEKWGPPTHPPQQGGTEQRAPHTSCHLPAGSDRGSMCSTNPAA